MTYPNGAQTVFQITCMGSVYSVEDGFFRIIPAFSSDRIYCRLTNCVSSHIMRLRECA